MTAELASMERAVDRVGSALKTSKELGGATGLEGGN
jgi:hypothetical protein